MEKRQRFVLLILVDAALVVAVLALWAHNVALLVICLLAAGAYGLLGQRGYWD